jgi:hypothetical protein
MNESAELDARPDDEYGRFESFARKLVNTPKPKPSPEDRPMPVDSAGEPAEDGSEGEEADGYDH